MSVMVKNDFSPVVVTHPLMRRMSMFFYPQLRERIMASHLYCVADGAYTEPKMIFQS